MVQIFFLFIFSALITSLFSNKAVSITLSCIFSLLISLEAFSIYVGGTFIDYKFYTHLNMGDIMVGKNEYLIEGLAGVLIAFLVSVLLFKFGVYLNKIYFHNKKLLSVILIFIIAFFLSINRGSIFKNLYLIYKVQTANEHTFNNALLSLGIPPNEYISPLAIKARPGKNIIIISMESIEKGFLADKFHAITPTLQKYSNELTYFEHMAQGPGSGWTSGSLYTLLTGVPAFMAGNGNERFQKTSEVKISSLGHVLKKAGYKSTFLIGEADFSGTRDLVNANKILVKDRDDFSVMYPETKWGLYDYDLFAEAKKTILQNKKTDNPFAVILSTVSTHPPNGSFDIRVKDSLPPNLSKYEYAIATLDYLIKDMFSFLKKENLLKNTSVFLFPDHLLMGLGNNKEMFDKLGENRQLYMITNAKPSKFTVNQEQNIYQIDLPKLILEGSEITTNVKFLSDFVKVSNKNKFLEENISNIVILNNASLKKRKFNGNINIKITEGGDLLISSKGDSLIVPNQNFKKGVTREFLFKEDLVLIKNKKIEFEKAFEYNEEIKEFLSLVIHVKDHTIFAYIGDRRKNGVTVKGEKMVVIKENQIQDLLTSKKWFQESVVYMQTPSPIINSSKIVSVTSSNYTTHKRIPTKINVGNVGFKYSRGLNVLYVKDGETYIESFDTYLSETATQSFLAFISEKIRNKKDFIIFVHDAAVNKIQKIKNNLKCLGFYDLLKLKPTQAYIANYNNGFLDEYVGNNTLSYIFPWRSSPESATHQSTNLNTQKNDFRKNNLRFIAHAGGKINGDNYTNSLEALNESYKRGFKLFELDINKTTDGTYVALHDWKNWAQVTGFRGKTPVTKEIFLKYKIKGKYTPLDIDRINLWFLKHPDAVLVTDKVNNPKDFAKFFIDKKRLMMELFSLDALKEGLNYGILSSMPTEHLLNSFKGDKVETLKNLGIKHVVISRRSIQKKKELLLELKKNNIKVFVYHVNSDSGIDEEYVVNKEFRYIYGLYADNWDFMKQSDCN